MNIYKIILGLFALSFITGCDDGKDKDFFLEDNIVVITKSQSVVNRKDGDLYQFANENWRVVITEGTQVLRTRATCSGLDTANASEILIGDTIFFKYKADNVNYAQTPNVVRPHIVEAYSTNCLDIIPAIVE
jgi:hypothetical protein